MSNLFDKLNLRPQERRLVVIVGIAVFVVLNYMFVWTHFGDLGIWQQRKQDAQNQLLQMQGEIGKKSAYTLQREELKESGGYVPGFQASTVLRRQVQNQALSSKVKLQSITPRSTQTISNAFFDEKGLLIRFQASEEALVDFLYNLGTNESLIRIEEISIGPDNRKRTELQGRIGLIGSFQKTPPARTTEPTTPTPPAPAANAAKTAASPPAPPANPTAKAAPKTKSSAPAPPKTKSSRPKAKSTSPPAMTPTPKTKSTQKTKSSPNSPAPQQINPAKTKSQAVSIPSRRIPPSSK